MTLEDFFTLTEIKDGLTAPSRVEELVAIMQKDKDCVVKNIGDATRQWAAVASTIAATKKKDCLDLFIQLDGLWYIDRWLKDAQKFSNDSTDSIEESIIALLRALENLHIDNERSISSGILITIKNLLGHSSSQVQDIARALFDNWNLERVSDAVHHDIESVGAYRGHGIRASAMLAGESSRPEYSAIDIPLSKRSAKEESQVEVPKAENLLRNSEDLKSERDEDVKIQNQKNEIHSDMILDCPDTKDRAPDHLPPSLVSNAVKENLSAKEKYPAKTVAEFTPVETGSFPLPKQGSVEGLSDAPELDEFSKDEKHVNKLSSSTDKLGIAASASSTMEPGSVSSGADVASAQIEAEPVLWKNVDAIEVRTPTYEPNSGTADTGVTNYCSKSVCTLTGQDDERDSDTLQDLSGNAPMYGKLEFLETAYSNMRGIAVDDDKEHTNSDGSEDLRNGSDFSRPAVGTRGLDVIDKRTTDIELEYGIVDALEVARKVAQEVEREVVDYREPSCSSSEKISGGIGQPGSPDSINGKQDLPTEAPPKEVPAGQNHSAEAYPEGKGHVINSGNLDNEAKKGINDMESSLVTDPAQEPEVNAEKGLCDFDLNQEVSSDDMDRNTVNSISTPIPVVSASRPAAAPGLPVAPLQFEGILGWKGSAATSAFRPASPRKIAGGDKAPSLGGTGNNSKQRQGCFDFDLNVAEGGDDKLADLMLRKQTPVLSGLQSAESSLEMSPRRSEMLKLDLNLIGDDGDTPPSDLKMERRVFYNRNGRHSPSPASSSSSMQPSLRNIDLNDRPHVHIDSSDQGPYHRRASQNISVCGRPKSDEPVISIMGTKVEVNRKDYLPQVSSLPNGKGLEPAVEANMARAGGALGLGPNVSYTPSSVFGFNGLTTAPGMSFSSAMYGPGGSIPYMVDSRGAPFMPQIIGSGSAVPPTYSQPPFIMSMTSAPLGLNGSGPPRPSFDLNSGFAVEGGNRDPVNLRQLFMPSQGRSVEEHLRANSQPSSSSGVGGKRKEPDGGWEYPFNYRHQQPPWK